eukprot:878054-Rhodomonas_salina.1
MEARESGVRLRGEGGVWQVMFWAHSVSNSAGMPGEFWLSVNFFVELAAPRSLLSGPPSQW